MTGLDPEAVRAFLRANPDVVRGDAELMALIAPRAVRADGVVDMAAYARDRLARELARLKDERATILEIAQANLEAQKRVHDAVLKIIDAQDFEEVVRVAANHLAPVVGADRAAFAVESLENETALVGQAAGGVRVLPPGGVDALLTPGQRSVVRATDERSAVLFGEHSEDLRSEAVVRLIFSSRAPHGVLAFASRDPRFFEAGQDTELLRFLAAALEASVRGWLHLPGPDEAM